MTAKIIPLQTRIEAAWQAYLEAATLAQQTLALEDGIKAGHAWRRWLELFITTEQKDSLGGRP